MIESKKTPFLMDPVVKQQPSQLIQFNNEDKSLNQTKMLTTTNVPTGLRGGGACFDCLACLCFCCAIEEIACFECCRDC